MTAKEVVFGFCENCKVVSAFPGESSSNECPICGGILVDKVIEESEEMDETCLCGTPISRLYVSAIWLYPQERKVEAGAIGDYWECPECGRSGALFDHEVREIRYPVIFVELTWKDFLKRLFELPDEVVFGRKGEWFIYSKLGEKNLVKWKNLKELVLVNVDGKTTLDPRSWGVTGDISLDNPKDMKNYLLVITKTGEIIYQGEEVSLEVLI